MPDPEMVVLGRLLHTGHCSSIARQDVDVNRLETQLARLVEQRVLSVSQARELADAARADQVDGQPAPVDLPWDQLRRVLRYWRSSATSVARWCLVR